MSNKFLVKNKSIIFVILSATVLRIIMMLLLNLKFMHWLELDSIGFNSIANNLATCYSNNVDVSSYHVSGDFIYQPLLGHIYYYIYSNILVGSTVSILAFLVTCVFLLKLLDYLGIRFKLFLLSLYCFNLSTIYYSVQTIRESILVLLFVLSVYYLLKFYRSWGLLNFGLFLLFTTLLARIHVGESIFAIVPMLLAFLSLIKWSRRQYKHKWKLSLNIVMLLGMCLVKSYWIPNLLEFKVKKIDTVEAVQQVEPIRQVFINKYINFYVSLVNGYRKGVRNNYARTTYLADLDGSSYFNLLTSSIVVVGNYLLQPFPSKVENFKDIFCFFETYFRILLLIASFSVYKRKPEILVLYLLFWFQTIIFAFASTNTGTAMRHGINSLWLLVILGGPQLNLLSRDILAKKIWYNLPFKRLRG